MIGCDVRREDRDAVFTVRQVRSALIIFHQSRKYCLLFSLEPDSPHLKKKTKKKNQIPPYWAKEPDSVPITVTNGALLIMLSCGLELIHGLRVFCPKYRPILGWYSYLFGPLYSSSSTQFPTPKLNQCLNSYLFRTQHISSPWICFYICFCYIYVQ